ncbi:hypothetical protein HPP92_005609 [Vanilla planifolia]|uniref:Uncharacterized protein n=1 Tax=Vanilla planifolia TaxID=51239 RepID=A0A835RLP7_VANPL|nr:hypothetical protein HPP92_005609 [Vanilla planifolia]
MAAAFSTSAPTLPSYLLRHPLSSLSTRPPADDLAHSWILEFILSQPIPDWLVHEIFLSLPFSSCTFHPHLRKAILIFLIASELRHRSLSERTLHSLELIEELDHLRGAAPSNRLKAAYCAVAVECTASAFRDGAADFACAVERIWMTRVPDIMRSEEAAGLVSGPLIEWAERIRGWVSSGVGGESLLNRDIEEALQLVSDYLEEAKDEIGPPFLEIVAVEVLKNKMDVDRLAEKSGSGLADMNSSLCKLVKPDKGFRENVLGEQYDCIAGVCIEASKADRTRERSGALADISGKESEGNEIREERGCASTKHGDVCRGVLAFDVDSREQEVVHLNNGGQDIPGSSEGVVHNLASGGVCQAESLQKGCLVVQMAAEDALLNAPAATAAVLASSGNKSAKCRSTAITASSISLVELVPGVESGHGAPAKKKCTLVPLTEFAESSPYDFKQSRGDKVAKECNMDAEPSNSRKFGTHHRIFERNPSAHTNEWSDESPSSIGKSPAPLDEIKLHKPTRRAAIPHLVNGKLIKRRPIKKWSSLEENTLREAVVKYGKGNWKLILSCFAKIFEERTEVDLKDKWRAMSRYLL